MTSCSHVRCKHLLIKWWWKLEKKEGLWHKLVKTKYLNNKPLALVKPRQRDSPCWVDILKIRHLYLGNRRMEVGSGLENSF